MKEFSDLINLFDDYREKIGPFCPVSEAFHPHPRLLQLEHTQFFHCFPKTMKFTLSKFVILDFLIKESMKHALNILLSSLWSGNVP